MGTGTTLARGGISTTTAADAPARFDHTLFATPRQRRSEHDRDGTSFGSGPTSRPPYGPVAMETSKVGEESSEEDLVVLDRA